MLEQVLVLCAILCAYIAGGALLLFWLAEERRKGQ